MALQINGLSEKIRVRVQELEADGNGRPIEEDLLGEDEWVADSIADLPSVGDFVALRVEGVTGDGEVKAYKVLTRLFDYQFQAPPEPYVVCNIVVRIATSDETALIVKD